MTFFSAGFWLKMMIVPRLPKTLWGGISTPKNQPKDLPEDYVGCFIPTKIGGLCLWSVSLLIFLLRFCLKILLFSQEIELKFFGSTHICLLVDQEKCWSPGSELHRIPCGCFFGRHPWKLRWQWKIPILNYKYCTSSNGGFSIGMLAFWGARLKQHRKEQRPCDFSALTLYIP